jgi:hypothetical protein
MKPLLTLPLLLCVAATTSLGCHGSSGGEGGAQEPVSAFAITPSKVNVVPGGTTGFIPSGKGVTSSKSVSWAVQESGGGTVTQDGTYTAPMSTGTYHVIATLVADKTMQSAATIQVGDVVGVLLSPKVLFAAPSGSATFAAAVQGTADAQEAGVTWSVQESNAGSVDASGHYSAPSTPGTYHVVATSVADSSQSARGAVVVGLADPAHVTQWDPGVIGGIPIRNKVCATIDANSFGNGSMDCSMALQKAVDACPVGEVVEMTAGTFQWNETVNLNKSITLRGAGSGQTIVNGNNTRYFFAGAEAIPEGNIFTTLVDHTLLTTDAAKGSNAIKVASTSGYQVGDLALVSMADDPTMWPVPSAGGDFLLWSDPNAANANAGRHSEGQMVRIAAVSADTLTIDGVLHSTYTVANQAVVGRAPQTFKNVGVEGIRFVRPAQSFFSFCDECWLTGCETDTSNGDLGWWTSWRGEISGNYIHNSQVYTQGGGGYGLTLDSYTSDTLVTNNIINYFNKPFLFRASGGGNVVSYNYADGGQDMGAAFWMEPDIDSHMAYSHMELVEGNLAGMIGLANTWGAAGELAVFRNRVLAQHQDPTLLHEQYQNQAAISFNAGDGAYSTIMGNVLGIPGLANTAGSYVGKAAVYENDSEMDPMDPPVSITGYMATQLPAIFRLGNYSEPGSYGDFDVNQTQDPMSPLIAPTVVRHGNFDYVTNSVRNDPNVTLTTLPDSFYLVDAPDFFAGSTWPWVQPAAATKAYTLPAKVRFDALTEQ